ncbi:MAG TPA: ABC transporter ATP-binding protein [Candidatus Dojkabacteria bacterium]|nr:ABC transporter ATP-binding protein [Candidatus Dojkabacteria bacterium]
MNIKNIFKKKNNNTTNLPEEKAEIKKVGIKGTFLVIAQTFKIYFQISPLLSSLLVVSSILINIRYLFFIIVSSKILDEIMFLIQNNSTDLTNIIKYLIYLLLYFIFGYSLLGAVKIHSSRSLRQISRSYLDRIIYKKIKTLRIEQLEDPEIVNLIKRSTEWAYDTFYLLQEALNLLAQIVKSIIYSVIILKFLPIIIPIQIIFTIIKYFPDKHYIKKEFDWSVDNTEDRRKANKSIDFLQNPATLQEISIIGSYSFLDSKIQKFYNKFNKGILKISYGRNLTSFFLDTGDSIIDTLSFLYIIWNTIQGYISIGDFNFQKSSIDQLQSSLGSIIESLSFTNEITIKVLDLFQLLNLEPSENNGNIKLPRLDHPPSVEFKNVWFKYPKSDKYVIKDFSLKINQGEKVAFVGKNGAGKSTLIKLIAKTYHPTKGKILIDGIDIEKLDIDDYYKNLGILFQEYNFYDNLTAKENIYLGKSVKEMDEEKIIEAAKNADAHEFISNFTNGYDQILSEKYTGGIRPSTGQKQKIAIARFFYRNAPLAIFDEPTSAIDAISEYKIFNKIYGFFENKTVIIISHRFSTVRNADKIIAIDEGKIAENGTHEELLSLNGLYAKSFNLQANGYNNNSSMLETTE